MPERAAANILICRDECTLTPMTGLPRLPRVMGMPTAGQREVLEAQLRVGGWPDAGLQAEEANRAPLVSRERVQAFAPDEYDIVLYPPPHSTVADELAENAEFWNRHGALHEIDPAKALLLGDFGHGSDTVFVADFRAKPPQVLRLQWTEQGNRWIQVAPTIEGLLSLLQLDSSGV